VSNPTGDALIEEIAGMKRQAVLLVEQRDALREIIKDAMQALARHPDTTPEELPVLITDALKAMYDKGYGQGLVALVVPEEEPPISGFSASDAERAMQPRYR
jgi:hypothetical protein